MAQHHAVAVVGAGPRGTSVVERLCAAAPALLAPDTRLTVHVVDPHPPGPGRVWRRDQPDELLMNTVASQVTLFTDASVAAEAPIRPGPSLYEWYRLIAPGVLGPDDYPTRSLYGAYLEWVFAEVRRSAPRGVRIVVHTAQAVRLADAPDGTQRLDLDDGTSLGPLTAVVLAQGHLPSQGRPEEQRLTAHAHRHGLRYLPPANPADLTAELAALGPGDPVLLRGLGLNFFDHAALLTTGRGGRFVPGRRRAAVRALRQGAAAVRGFTPRRALPRARRQREGPARPAPAAAADAGHRRGSAAPDSGR